MSHKNPVTEFVRHTLPETDVLALDALEEAFNGLYDAATEARELGNHGMAERLDAIADYVAFETEAIISGMEEGSDIELQGGEIEPSLEENLAMIYGEYLILKSGRRSSYSSEEDIFEAMRSAFDEHQRMRFNGIDSEMLAAAKDAYEYFEKHKQRGR